MIKMIFGQINISDKSLTKITDKITLITGLEEKPPLLCEFLYNITLKNSIYTVMSFIPIFGSPSNF